MTGRRTGTAAETLAGLFGGVGPLARPDDLRRWCSHTTDGRFIPPIDIVLEALRGQIRLVITDERGVVLHMGHRKRLFTGALRQAVMLAATRCTHPGCDVASGDSQADHLTPHSTGGITAITNGGPGCGTHNRWRYVNRATTLSTPTATGTPTEPTAPKSPERARSQCRHADQVACVQIVAAFDHAHLTRALGRWLAGLVDDRAAPVRCLGRGHTVQHHRHRLVGDHRGGRATIWDVPL